MKIILAVSGGVDSMVMLDMIYQCGHYSPRDIIVGHFDHGTRPSSKDDADFVENIVARKYHLPFFCQKDNLGEEVSEEVARTHRYDFLRHLASDLATPQTADPSGTKPDRPKIFTAHHLDDLVESVAINLLRGTGWRGLSALDTPGIIRPFLAPESMGTDTPWDKKAILKYAAKHSITFRQDPTNSSDHYLRNRVRQKLTNFPSSKKQEIYHLWQKQKSLKQEINDLVVKLAPPHGSPWQRSWFDDFDDKAALELLRTGVLSAGISATRPQLRDFLHAIRTYAPGKYFNLPNCLIRLEKDHFVL